MSVPKRPTGKHLTQDQGISAMLTLARFCEEHSGCNGCVFNKIGEPCLLKEGKSPALWPKVAAERWETRN